MVSKTITIKKDIYDMLMRIKHQDESFSDLFERLAKKDRPLDILERISGSLDLGSTDEILKEIRFKREEERQ